MHDGKAGLVKRGFEKLPEAGFFWRSASAIRMPIAA
jgi:hypothetical protein